MVVVPSKVDSVFFTPEKYPFRCYFISLFVCPSNGLSPALSCAYVLYMCAFCRDGRALALFYIICIYTLSVCVL